LLNQGGLGFLENPTIGGLEFLENSNISFFLVGPHPTLRKHVTKWYQSQVSITHSFKLWMIIVYINVLMISFKNSKKKWLRRLLE